MLDGPHGMKIVPGASGISECVALHPRQQLRLTRELARIESDFDFMLIDTAAGIADTTLDFVSAAHHTLVVITPEPTSLTDAFSLIKLLKRRRSSIHYHVVVNICSSAGQAKEVFHRFSAAVEKYIGVQCHYLGYLLRDESMRAAVVLQNPVAMFPDEDPSCRGFVKLADELTVATSASPVTTSFSAYWHRQYREQRHSGGKSLQPKTLQAVSVSSAETRDSDYLSELRSRILLLIEQGHAEQELIQSLLQESIEAYIKRYKEPPLDGLGLIDLLVQCPERDDQLLRDIAERVKPWGTSYNWPPTMELAQICKDTNSIAAQSPDQMQEHRSAGSEWVESIETVVKQSVAVVHHYDSARFGSQENLLDILQRQGNSNKSLAELLGALV
jgi:MinD-like ATPase involved in chromosome partitioning or flagellar assembly